MASSTTPPSVGLCTAPGENRQALANALLAWGYHVVCPDNPVRWAADSPSSSGATAVIVDAGARDFRATVHRLRRAAPQVIVIAVVGSDRVDDAVQAIRCGATAATWESTPAHVAVRLVADAMAGRATLPVEVVSVLAGGRAVRDFLGLEADDIDLLELVAEGLPMQTIARRLHLSERTAYRRWQGVLAKLGAQSREQALVVAERFGLLR
jgi:DNA-binding NarL/FixJ family response regulator